MTRDSLCILHAIYREPGSTAECIARCLGWYLGRGVWDTKRVEMHMGGLIRHRGVYKCGNGYFIAPKHRTREFARSGVPGYMTFTGGGDAPVKESR